MTRNLEKGADFRSAAVNRPGQLFIKTQLSNRKQALPPSVGLSLSHQNWTPMIVFAGKQIRENDCQDKASNKGSSRDNVKILAPHILYIAFYN